MQVVGVLEIEMTVYCSIIHSVRWSTYAIYIYTHMLHIVAAPAATILECLYIRQKLFHMVGLDYLANVYEDN